MANDERDLQAQQPADVAWLLQDSAAQGYAVYFPALTARIADADIADQTRRDALVEAAQAKLFETMARGQFGDLQGARAFFDRLGIDHLELSEQIVGDMRELNDRVGDSVFTLVGTSYDGKVLVEGKWVSTAEAGLIRDRAILTTAGYTEEQLPTMLPKLRMFRHTIQALRAGPNSDIHGGFYTNVLPLFDGQQRNALQAMAVPRQLPPRR